MEKETVQECNLPCVMCLEATNKKERLRRKKEMFIQNSPESTEILSESKKSWRRKKTMENIL